MAEEYGPVKVPRVIYEQLCAVRETGAANMANLDGVQDISDRCEFTELFFWVEDNRKTRALGRGVLFGFEPEDES
jgi:hypothetical protein